MSFVSLLREAKTRIQEQTPSYPSILRSSELHQKTALRSFRERQYFRHTITATTHKYQYVSLFIHMHLPIDRLRGRQVFSCLACNSYCLRPTSFSSDDRTRLALDVLENKFLFFERWRCSSSLSRPSLSGRCHPF